MALRESSKFAVVAFKDYELTDGKTAHLNEDQVMAELENIPVILERDFFNFSAALPRTSYPVEEANEGGSNSPHNMNSFGETFQEIFYGKLVKTLLQYY